VENTHGQNIGMVRILEEDVMYWGEQKEKAKYIHSLVVIEKFEGRGIGKTILQKIEKLENIKQFFIYRSSENINAFGSKIEWLPDDNYIIEKVFHPIHYPFGGYIIINNNGTYLSQRGEYCYSKELIKEVKDFANN